MAKIIVPGWGYLKRFRAGKFVILPHESDMMGFWIGERMSGMYITIEEPPNNSWTWIWHGY